MNGMILGCCRMLKLPTGRIFSIRYLMRFLQRKSQPPQVDDSREPPIDLFRRAAALAANDTLLSRVWTEEEIRWQLHRDGGLVACHRSGTREGLVTGYLMQAANPQKTNCLLIEDVLWGNLENEERSALVEKMLDRARQAGAQLALLPCLNYADVAPFRAARFRASPRILNCYLTIFSGQPAPEPVSSMYLDVV
jgi:hypothetical protein